MRRAVLNLAVNLILTKSYSSFTAFSASLCIKCFTDVIRSLVVLVSVMFFVFYPKYSSALPDDIGEFNNTYLR